MRRDQAQVEKKGQRPYHLTGDQWKLSLALKRQCECEGDVIFHRLHEQTKQTNIRRIAVYELTGEINSQ